MTCLIKRKHQRSLLRKTTSVRAALARCAPCTPSRQNLKGKKWLLKRVQGRKSVEGRLCSFLLSNTTIGANLKPIQRNFLFRPLRKDTRLRATKVEIMGGFPCPWKWRFLFKSLRKDHGLKLPKSRSWAVLNVLENDAFCLDIWGWITIKSYQIEIMVGFPRPWKWRVVEDCLCSRASRDNGY